MKYNNWKTVRLGDVCVLNYGKSLVATNRKAGVIPVYSSAGITGWHNEPLVKGEGIIVGRKGTVGSVYHSKEPFYCIDTAYYILPDNAYDFRYMYYRLKSLGLEKLNEDSAVPGLNRETAYSQEFLLPPIEEQGRIAGILGALDDKIECNNRINRNLEEQAAVLFRRWFVDFEFPDPDSTSPTYGKPYRSAGGKMQDSPLGSIPKDWQVGTLGEIIDVRDGTHNSPKQTDRGKFLITSKHLKSDGTIDFNSAYRISDADYNEINKRSKVDTNDILFSMIGTIGNMLLVECENIDFAIKNIALFKTSKNIPMSYFLYLHFKSNCFIEYINSRLAGSTQQYITLSSLRSIPILISSDKLLNEFTSITEPLFKTMSINRIENQTLATLCNTLLPKLMNNEI